MRTASGAYRAATPFALRALNSRTQVSRRRFISAAKLSVLRDSELGDVRVAGLSCATARVAIIINVTSEWLIRGRVNICAPMRLGQVPVPAFQSCLRYFESFVILPTAERWAIISRPSGAGPVVEPHASSRTPGAGCRTPASSHARQFHSCHSSHEVSFAHLLKHFSHLNVLAEQVV